MHGTVTKWVQACIECSKQQVPVLSSYYHAQKSDALHTQPLLWQHRSPKPGTSHTRKGLLHIMTATASIAKHAFTAVLNVILRQTPSQPCTAARQSWRPQPTANCPSNRPSKLLASFFCSSPAPTARKKWQFGHAVARCQHASSTMINLHVEHPAAAIHPCSAAAHKTHRRFLASQRAKAEQQCSLQAHISNNADAVAPPASTQGVRQINSMTPGIQQACNQALAKSSCHLM